MPKSTQKSGRSHFGCIQCKTRKVKCDEKKPVCSNCTRLRLECEYTDKWAKYRKNTTSGDRDGGGGAIDSITNNPMRDLKYEFLMYHYCVFTAKTFLLPGEDSCDLFLVEYPKKGFQYRFLLDTIYLISSAHLNHLTPCAEYQQYVLHFNALAAAGIRTQLEEANLSEDLERSEAIAMASTLLSTFALTNDVDTPFNGVIGSLMPLFRGMSIVFHYLWPNRHKTRFKFLDEQIKGFRNMPSGDEYLPQIEKVFELQPDHHEIYREATTRLAQLAVAFLTEEYKLYRMFHVSRWMISLPAEFLTMLNNFDPCALVILAQFFRISSRDSSWFLGEYAYKHYLRVSEKIPPKWLPYARAELKEMGSVSIEQQRK